jgi:serine/threonine protein kinase
MSEGTIFIVDDNPNNLTLLSGILREAGYDVRAANSGRRALQILERQPSELVLLDIQMPEVDGYQVCRTLKESPELRQIPVIFVSALDDVFDKVKAFEVGGVDYVTKPYDAAEVLARVGAQLRLSRLQLELERRNAELQRKNEELLVAQRKTEQVFSALSEVLPGTVLADTYRIDAMIGEGGFGAVFRGFHLNLQRPVAVKVLRPTSAGLSTEGLERFRLEGIAACRVDHPNAVDVLDFGVTPAGIAYLVMELLRGYSAEWLLQNRGVLPPGRCAEILVPVCEALAEAHNQGVVHRDVKPENIFLHQTKRGEVVKVVDFGLAKLFEESDADRSSLTIEGTILGTPNYMAPERVIGEPYDGKSDVYSIGVVLYRMLCGALPYAHTGTSNPYLSALMHVTTPPRPLREVNPGVTTEAEKLTLRALAKVPANRPTAREMADELRGLAAHHTEGHGAVVPSAEPGSNPAVPHTDESS